MIQPSLTTNPTSAINERIPDWKAGVMLNAVTHAAAAQTALTVRVRVCVIERPP
jgi:hypothetical protein